MILFEEFFFLLKEKKVLKTSKLVTSKELAYEVREN